MSTISTRLRTFLRPVDRRVCANSVSSRPNGALWRAVLFGERYVVNRSLLHFERIQRPAGTVDQRVRRAVTLAARTRAPFDNPGVHISWSARHAVAWSWDGTRLARLGIPEHAWIVPEPAVMQADPLQSDGFRLRELEDGFEGQLLQGGEVLASRFWPHRPGDSEIDIFLRGGAPHQADELPAAAPSSLAFGEAVRGWVRRLRPVHAALGALILLGPAMLYQAGDRARLTYEVQTARSQLEAVMTESASQFTALQAYQASRDRLSLYRDALNLTHPLEPAAELAESAQAAEGSLQSFRIAPGRVEAILTASNADPAVIVQRLEQADSLMNVSISRARRQGDWEIRADLAAPVAETVREP